MPLSTVSLVLKRHGLGRRSALIPKQQQRRYERSRPGELVHVDIKKLARIDGAGHRVHGDRGLQPNRPPRKQVGYEFVHVCVDDATRLAYAEVLGDERATTAVGFLRRALRFFRSMGVRVERVMTDNGSAYISRLHARALSLLGVRHVRIRPRRPQTNGKAERFIRTLLDGWAYGAIYGTSHERQQALPGWLELYNRRRPHGSLSRQTPVQRLNNLLGSYIYGADASSACHARAGSVPCTGTSSEPPCRSVSRRPGSAAAGGLADGVTVGLRATKVVEWDGSAEVEALGVVDAELARAARAVSSSPTNSAIVRLPMPRAISTTALDDELVGRVGVCSSRTNSPSILR